MLTSLFVVEVIHFFKTGQWVLHGGLGAFSRWPMNSQLNLEVSLHAGGMLAWIGVVIHQLLTRGSGFHKRVGRIGVIGVSVALLIALRPTSASDVPILHGALGFSLMDLTMWITIVGILEEMAIALYKIRRNNVDGHRKHVMTAVLFTAGPGLYRLNVEWLTWMLDLRSEDASIWQTGWVHEMSLAGTLLIFLLLMYSRPLGGHVDTLRQPEKHDAIERGLARFMLGLITVLIVAFSLWTLDLLLTWSSGGEVIDRAAASGFVLNYFSG